MNLWFTSDTHFRHANILAFTYVDRRACMVDERTCTYTCKASHPMIPLRPFSNVQMMDEFMIEQWNAVVKPNDHVYHLGDVTMNRGSNAKEVEPILDRLHGHKRLILGNHDVQPVEWYLRWFEKVMSYRVMDGILFSHIPVHPNSLGRFRANVHGHTHQMCYNRPYYNICVERTDYQPVAWEEIQQWVNA